MRFSPSGPSRRSVRVIFLVLAGSLTPETSRATEETAAPEAEVVLRVLDRDSKTPLAGASLAEPATTAPPGERLLLDALRKRAPSAGPDGLLRLGAISRQPLSLTVVARGHRSATLKLPVGFEAGQRDLLLAPPQALDIAVNGLDVKKDEVAPAVVLYRCESSADPCDPRRLTSQPLRRRVEDGDVARFGPLAAGRYRAFLEAWGSRGSSEFAAVSDRSEDADAVRVDLDVLRRTFRGRVHLKDDTPVTATLSASLGFERGKPSDQGLGNVRSSPDGSFELSLLVPPGRRVSIWADSENPVGKGTWFEGALTLDPVDIVVHVGAVIASLKERRTGNPVSACAVSARLSGGGATRYQTLDSDENGRIRFEGLSAGAVEVTPRCKGFAARAPLRVELAEEETREEIILLDRTSEILVRVADMRGAPVAGATVVGLDVLHSGRGFVTSRSLGTTDSDGTLKIPGDQWAGIPFFVFAAGYGLSVARFPAAGACEEQTECTAPVVLSVPSAFFGLSVRDVAGKRSPLRLLQFWKDGIPIPGDIVEEAAALNGLSSNGDLLFGPEVLQPGSYEVRALWMNEAQTRSEFLPAGFLRIPSDRPIDLTFGPVPRLVVDRTR